VRASHHWHYVPLTREEDYVITKNAENPVNQSK